MAEHAELGALGRPGRPSPERSRAPVRPSAPIRIYLDCNASTPLRPEALEAMRPFLSGNHGNPSSLHQEGQRARAALEEARGRCAAVLHCRPEELVFTSGGTEADNLALRGLAWARRGRGLSLVCSRIEHPAVRETVEALAAEGFRAEWVEPGPDGVVAADALAQRLGPGTALAALMLANNETGVIQPVAAVAEACRRAGVPFHVDAVQAAGRLALDVRQLGCDTLALSAHKFEGPKGAGLLYIKAGVRLSPQLTGGGQERLLRGGTENVAGMVGLAEALCLAERERLAEGARQARLRGILEAGLRGAGCGGVVLGSPEPSLRLPNTLFMAFPGCVAADLVMALDLEGIAVSTGAACAEGTAQPSVVLKAMGVADSLRGAAVRFSLGRQTTLGEVEAAIRIVAEVAGRLRGG